MKQIKPTKSIKLTKEELVKEDELLRKYDTTGMSQQEKEAANEKFNIEMFNSVVIPRAIKAIKGAYKITWVEFAAAIEDLKKWKRMFKPKLNPEEYAEELECLDFEIQLCREELNRKDLHWLDRKAYRRRLKAAIERREYAEQCGIKL